MVKIEIEEDCGNAPKKELIKQLLIACSERNTDFILENLSSDIRWSVVGQEESVGKEQVAEWLGSQRKDKVEALRVSNILSHGDRCAADGSVTFTNGRKVAFCTVYTFNGHSKSAKIRSIETYQVNLS